MNCPVFFSPSRKYDLVNVWMNSTLCKLIAFIFELLERSICTDKYCLKEWLSAVTFQKKKNKLINTELLNVTQVVLIKP